MKSYVFRVVVEKDEMEDGTPAFHGFCPALPGCHTWGDTPEETLARVQDAVSLYVEDLIAS
jgi:predicted RNase H-like HicB family nuclease